jgi:hypothetical protein
MSGFELYLCYQAYKNADCEYEFGIQILHKALVDFPAWVEVQGAIALCNLLLVPYIQWRIGQHLDDELEASEAKINVDGYVDVPKTDVQAAFKNAFLYDFAVLIYFFDCMASFIWSCMGLRWMALTGKCRIEFLGLGGLAAYCGITLCGVTLLYLFAWYCCDCCAKSLKIQPDPWKGFLAPKDTDFWEGNEGRF